MLCLLFLPLISSCASPDATFKEGVRENINSSYDPQINKELQEAFKRYVGWDEAKELAEQYCQWSEEKLTDQEITRIMVNKAEGTAKPGDETALSMVT